MAQRVRHAWGIPAGPIPNVVGLLERHGIVVRLPLDTSTPARRRRAEVMAASAAGAL